MDAIFPRDLKTIPASVLLRKMRVSKITKSPRKISGSGKKSKTPRRKNNAILGGSKLSDALSILAGPAGWAYLGYKKNKEKKQKEAAARRKKQEEQWKTTPPEIPEYLPDMPGEEDNIYNLPYYDPEMPEYDPVKKPRKTSGINVFQQRLQQRLQKQ